MSKDILICIPVLSSRLEFAQRVSLPSLRNSLNAYQGPVQFSVSLVAYNIEPEALEYFSTLPRWHIQYIHQTITPCPFGDRLGMFHALRQAALTGYSYYLLAHDDFKFHEESVKRYAEIVLAMEANPQVGTVMCGSVLGGGSHKSEPFYPYPEQSVWISKGLIVRNLGRLHPEKYTAIFPKESADWQRVVFSPDNLLGCLPLLEGLTIAKSYNHWTKHYNSPCGGTANLPKDYQPLLAGKMGILYPIFQITQNWKDADDWELGAQLFGENLIFNRDIMGSRKGKPATAGCLEYSDVFKPSRRFSRVTKPVKVKAAKVKAARVSNPRPPKKNRMFFD